MGTYRHYSFDLWLTLIRSNPDFKLERARYFHERYNPLGKPIEEVQRVFRQVDIMVNAINEKTGGNIDAEEMYLMVISHLADGAADFSDVDVDALYEAMETLLFDHIPHVYCNDTKRVLRSVKEVPGTGLNILSNTGFIKGRTLRRILQELELAPYFDFQLYSDELGLSKPDPRLFKHLLGAVRAQHGPEPVTIIHVGDNPRADVQGALAAGIHAHLVHSNNLSIATLLEL